ncbi:MAG: hypothetical protein ACD_20C00032G0001 [uncultured bacterium]|nr:MAG: hypothetical protein ACD_20C00032G0001 [uncultured bacterium]
MEIITGVLWGKSSISLSLISTSFFARFFKTGKIVCSRLNSNSIIRAFLKPLYKAILLNSCHILSIATAGNNSSLWARIAFFVFCSISKSNLAESLIARIIRNRSSFILLCGSPIQRIIFFFRSSCPCT